MREKDKQELFNTIEDTLKYYIAQYEEAQDDETKLSDLADRLVEFSDFIWDIRQHLRFYNHKVDMIKAKTTKSWHKAFEDKVEREKIVADLMSRLHNGDGFELSKNVGVEQIYFSNFDHNSNIKSIKEQILTDIESYFNDIIQ